MNKNKTKICSFVLLVCFVFGLYTLFHSTLTLSLRMRCSILKLSKYGTLMKKIRGILSDYGTPKNCRIMGPVGFWDRTDEFVLERYLESVDFPPSQCRTGPALVE